MAGIGEIAKAAGTKSEVVVDVFEAVFKLARKGENVRILGFGTFSKKKFKGRKGLESPVINDGEPLTIPPSYRLAFKQSGQAKRRMNPRKPSKSATKVKKGKKKGKKK